jgi:predicted DsbA family dithiol-disulfide isomerase
MHNTVIPPAGPAGRPGLQVEVWSDVVCPWCYLGKRRLESALTRFPSREAVEVRFRSYQLDPGAPARYPGSSADLLASRYGMSPREAARRNAEMEALAAAAGLEYHLDRTKPGNTFDAHRLLHLAAGRGLGGAAEERFFRGYFTEGVAVGDHDQLAGMAVDVGLDPVEVKEVLAGDALASEVRADIEAARRLGARGVPFFVVNRTFGLSGAQPADKLLAVLEQAWSDLVAGGPAGEAG